MKEKYALGIDIGGTNTVVGLVDKAGNILKEFSLKTKQFLPNELVEKIALKVNEIAISTQILGICIGAPNGNEQTGCVENAPNLDWEGIVPLAQMFQEKFQVIAFLINDANAAAVGEMIFGKATNFKNFVSITLGTGLGSGIISNGELLTGANGLAGEFGHIRVKENGRLCGCGRKGCLETYASSTGVARSFHELNSVNKSTSSVIKLEKIHAKAIFDAAIKNDSFALEIIDFTAEILGNALADFCAFSDPEAFVLFGGIAQSGEFFRSKVEEHFKANILHIYKDKVQILVSDLHDKNAAVLGCAASVFYKLNRK